MVLDRELLKLGYGKYRFDVPSIRKKKKKNKKRRGRGLYVNPLDPITPVTPDSSDSSDTSPEASTSRAPRVVKDYCFKNRFLSINDPRVITTERPFPGPPKPIVKSCRSRYLNDFQQFNEFLGQGYFCYCQKAFHRLDGCYYAIKISRDEYNMLDDSRELRRLQNEIHVMSYLGPHKNIVGYHGAWFEKGRLHLQMEFCDGSLESKSKEGAFKTEIEFQCVLYQVAKGLQHIHAEGIKHLDLKPANILVKDGVYKIGDFGQSKIAKELIVDEDFYEKGGNGRYMTRNCGATNGICFSQKSDISALGISIYEIMMRRNNPNSGEFRMPLSGIIQFEYLPGFSPEFINLLQTMVDPNPNIRPSSAEILIDPVLKLARFHCESQ